MFTSVSFSLRNSKNQFFCIFAIFLGLTGCNVNPIPQASTIGQVTSTNDNKVFFTPTIESATQSPLIRFQGTTLLLGRINEDRKEDYFDLDKNKFSLNNYQEGDIVFYGSRGTATTLLIKPVNGAKFLFDDLEKIDLDYCVKNKSKITKGGTPEIDIGKQICVITNEGRIAIIKFVNKPIIEIIKNKEYGIEIEYSVLDSLD